MCCVVSMWCVSFQQGSACRGVRQQVTYWALGAQRKMHRKPNAVRQLLENKQAFPFRHHLHIGKFFCLLYHVLSSVIACLCKSLELWPKFCLFLLFCGFVKVCARCWKHPHLLVRHATCTPFPSAHRRASSSKGCVLPCCICCSQLFLCRWAHEIILPCIVALDDKIKQQMEWLFNHNTFLQGPRLASEMHFLREENELLEERIEILTQEVYLPVTIGFAIKQKHFHAKLVLLLFLPQREAKNAMWRRNTSVLRMLVAAIPNNLHLAFCSQCHVQVCMCL